MEQKRSGQPSTRLSFCLSGLTSSCISLSLSGLQSVWTAIGLVWTTVCPDCRLYLGEPLSVCLYGPPLYLSV
jgi:hypothetical protein